MDKKKITLSFNTSFSEITDLNPNFALGKMRIAYSGDNRNGSSISKEVFEDAIPTMYNCPIVARYCRDTNSFGSHDIEIVINGNELKIVNATQPLGVIPGGSDWYWETVVEDDGVEHQYLIATVLLWKRQEAYDHILELGKIKQSFECDFTQYHTDNRNYLVADKICFSAFCLLESAEPCFESASVQVFSEATNELFKQQFSQMIEELKEFTDQQPIKLGFDTKPNEGGNKLIFTEEVRDSILAEFEINLEDLDFEINDETTEEIFRKAIEEFVQTKKESSEPDGGQAESQSFSATYRQKEEALDNALDPIIVKEGDVLVSETYFRICDFNNDYVFVEKITWSVDNRETEHGRIKYVFDEGSGKAILNTGDFEVMVVTWLTIAENQKLEESRKMFSELVNFKDSRLKEDHKNEINAILSDFEDIKDVTEFETLKDKVYEYEDIEDLKTKLFAIRGKQVKVAFEKKKEDSHVRVPVTHSEDEPYGGLFQIFKTN